MPSPKQLIIASLKDMARTCVREQIRLKALRATRRSLEADERATLRRIRQIKAKIDRELVVSGPLLGFRPLDLED